MKAIDLARATPNTKIYVDMDGVLADFCHKYAEIAGIEPDANGWCDYRKVNKQADTEVLESIVGTDFFYILPKFPTADKLIQIVLGYVPNYSICSTPLHSDVANSTKWKKAWIRKELAVMPAEEVYTATKEQWAVNSDGSPNVLIDDRGDNINKWKARGGIGIKYQADEDSLDKIIKGLEHAYGK